MNTLLLKSLRLKDFLSHENSFIEFNPTQKVLVDGASGSGKTAILEGITWALYGRGRVDNRSIIRRGSKKAEVELTLASGDTLYTITRVVSAEGKHTLVVLIGNTAHPMARLRELQNWIEKELLGASYLLFVNSVAYLQGGAELFVSQPASDRKDLLLEIVQSSNFDELYEKTRRKIEEKETQYAMVGKQVEDLDRWVDHANEELKNKEQVDRSVSEYKELIENQKTEIQAVNMRVASFETLNTNVSVFRNALDQMKTQQIAIDADIALAESAISELNGIRPAEEKLETIKVDVVKLDKRIQEILDILNQCAEFNIKRSEKMVEKPIDYGFENEIISLDKELSLLMTGDQCPSKEQCPHEKNKHKKIQEITQKVLETTKNKKKFEQSLEQWQQEYNALEKPPHDSLVYHDELKNVRSEKSALQREQVILESRNSKKEYWLSEASRLPKAQEAREKLMESIRSTENDLGVAIAALDEESYKKTLATLTELKTELTKKEAILHTFIGQAAVLEKLRVELEEKLRQRLKIKEELGGSVEVMRKLNLLKDAFGAKGIRAVVIDYLLPNLEERINTVLSRMSDFRVHLDTQQQKVDGGGNKEGLFINIVNEMGEEMPFESYSGGERLKIVVAISEALATLQKVGFRMFDETILSLDENSLEGFMSVLTNLLERFPQVLCVSHIQEIKDAFQEKVFISKHNGISSVAYGQ